MRIGSLGVKFALVLLVGVILAGGFDLVRADSLDVVVSVSTDKNVYGWGETVTIRVSVTNIGSSTLDLTFPTTHQAGYSIYLVRGQTLKLVWTTYNDGYYFLETYLTLEPSETKNFTFKWVQTSETDVKIKPATYAIIGYLYHSVTIPWSTWSERSEFDIRGKGYSEH